MHRLLSNWLLMMLACGGAFAQQQQPANTGSLSWTNVQSFTTPGTFTWTNPVGAPAITRVFICAGGGGGGSGADLAATTAGSGGGGGGGAACMEASFNTAQLGATETVTVGAAGTAGAAVTSTGAGNPGGIGGSSSFGTTPYLTAYGGGGGAGGGSAINSGGGGGGGPWYAATSAITPQLCLIKLSNRHVKLSGNSRLQKEHTLGTSPTRVRLC